VPRSQRRWYWKECGGASPNTWLTCRGAVELWEPRTDCFPDGLSFKEPLPLALHNRYFSANNNTYANALGFASSFIIEKSVDLALPVKADVFTYMMAKAKAWGAVLYEQVRGRGRADAARALLLLLLHRRRRRPNPGSCRFSRLRRTGW